MVLEIALKVYTLRNLNEQTTELTSGSGRDRVGESKPESKFKVPPKHSLGVVNEEK